ncbi:putative powdery mildew resistance protein, RPW8 [Medicago truncatula]|uniref:Disease resistance protein (CC-NBS-LRR class) family protein n=1 Tax=Medicago truncatula TaxID=3880 RepID=G7K9C6_MEDTR|nr:probable disease resistance protein At5g66900 [Medicago truncatula]AES94769.1 disease resistance protein (CC-NBS-LRR class) family protein [Medicago truncatula]RHN54074.1 putative powdery mildew resistance protein, RPW8 [Medicago truncatula]
MADALSGVVVGKIVNQAYETIKNIQEFVPTLERSIEISNALEPLAEQIKVFNDVLDRPREEIERLEKHIREGKELVQKSKKLSLNLWKCLLFPGQRAKLQKQNEDFLRYLSLVQVENKRDLMEVLTHVKDNHVNQIRGLCGAPQEPEFIGMVKQFNELKVELMKDGASVLVLTGLGGSGKTTLAKKLCWEQEIKGKFGGNIFFVTVSETPNLKNIVKTLFEQCGRPVPDFTNEEDAINQLGHLLSQFERSQILLVLDDVWPGSESLVEKFTFKLPDYKILVTSRVGFRRFGTPCQLNPLDEDPAASLFRHYAQLHHIISYMPDGDLVDEIVKACKGSPLVLKVIAGSLRNQPFEKWLDMKERLNSQSIFESNSTDLLCRLQQSLDMLEDINEKECFLDMGLFPEDQRIPVTVLIDMWAELYNLDEGGIKAMTIIHDLITRNFINVIATRQVATETDMYYNNHYVMLHDLLRELAIRQSKGESFEQRKRLIIDLNGDTRPDWLIGLNQQGIIGQKQRKVDARILSISTVENFSSDWCDMQPDEAEVLVLNLRSDQYSLPDFTDKMRKLKVLIVTNYGFNHSELTEFELLGSLSNLKRIRLEKVSVPCLCILTNLRKLSLHMCNTRDSFENCSIQISDAMPNLVELSIDYCNDLIKLPDELCNITTLKKLSITNCHKLSLMPRDIGKLENLEVLRLCSCSDLEEMPESVAGLNKLCCLDISDCVTLSKLSNDIGDLKKLEKFYMKGCSNLNDLPYSVFNFGNVKHEIHVICDEEGAALWEQYPNIPNLKIDMPKVESNLNWLHGTRS